MPDPKEPKPKRRKQEKKRDKDRTKDRPSTSSEGISKESSSRDDTITEKNYEGHNYLHDEEIMDKFSIEIEQSDRYMISAVSAMDKLLSKSKTTRETVLQRFKDKYVKKLKEDRTKQVDVPKVVLPSDHSKCKCGHSSDTTSDDSDADSDSDTESSSSGSDDKEESSSDEKVEKDSRRSSVDAKKPKQRTSYTRMEIERKRSHPNAVCPDICYNEKGYTNDGPICRCSFASRTQGLRHNYYAGEDVAYKCDKKTSNPESLFHYFLKVTPFPANNQISRTFFTAACEEFEFEGFSIITHEPLPRYMPRLPISRWSLEYEFHFLREKIPEDCFTVEECDILTETIFHDIYEMWDFEVKSPYLQEEDGDVCPVFHFMPRFVSKGANGYGGKILPLKGVLAYLLTKFDNAVIDPIEVKRLMKLDEDQFNKQTTRYKQNILVRTDKKPSAIRVDSFERDEKTGKLFFIHNSVRPSVYTNFYSGKISFLGRHLGRRRHLSLTGNASFNDAETEAMKRQLEELRTEAKNMRVLRLRKPLDSYRATGLFPDTIAHVLMVILATHHARYQLSLNVLEKTMNYEFKNRNIIELAMTHISFKNNYGTIPDHAKNLISNCGYRRKYVLEERREKKKGMQNLVNIMGTTGTDTSEIQNAMHNERLEYLGDAVVEMIASNHLFFMLYHHNEGGLATYRTSVVQNRNLATLAKNIRLDEFLQFTHGVELCHEQDFRHALANAFEALMAAVFLDGGLDDCDRIFSTAMFSHDPESKLTWDHINEHELKRENPEGDRDLADSVATLEKLKELEESLGIEFNNIRLLAKAFTRRNFPYSDLTRGNHQRLEWLGDTVLQLVISDYLYRHFPMHHEGHMSLLRTSLVSNQTQALICEDLGFEEYVLKPNFKVGELRTKDKADLVEAFIGALFVDRGMEHCRTFIRTVFLPRLAHFIESDKWNDPKSHFQQYCLTLRDPDNPKPSIPDYRVLRAEGPTNTRIYSVAVYFRNRKLAIGEGTTVHAAELDAAKKALTKYKNSDFRNLKAKHGRDWKSRSRTEKPVF